MTADAKHSPNGDSWTHETLFRYFDALIAGNDRRYSESLENSKNAITKAESATDRRLEGMNEFRDALEASDRDNVKRKEYDVAMAGLQTKIDTAFSLTGKRVDDLSAQVSMLIGLVNDSAKVDQANKTGRSEGWKDIALLISIVVAVLAVASRFIK